MNDKCEFIPYKLCNYVEVSIIENNIFYINLSQGTFIYIPQELHNRVMMDEKEFKVASKLVDFDYFLELLVRYNFIEPDLAKLQFGEESVFIPQKEKEYFEFTCIVDLYVDNIEIIDLLKKKKFINEYTHINLIFNAEKTRIKLQDFSGNIIINSFDYLYYFNDISNKKIIIECFNLPKNNDVNLLKQILLKNKIIIKLPYYINESISREVYNIFRKIDNANLKIIYDICLLHNNNENNENTKIIKMINKPHLKQIKVSCGAGTRKFYVDKKGFIFPCYRLKDRGAICNINTESFENFLSKENKKIIGGNKCSDCEMRLFCGQGCQAEYNEFDYKFCENIKQILSDEYGEQNNILINDFFNLEQLKDFTDLSMYEYMCERNALRMLLIGYGVQEPLLFMNCGLFLQDEDFFNTGNFSTNFSRSMLNPLLVPILGDNKYKLDWEIIDNHLNKNNPVLVVVDVYYMPYKQNTYYMKSHGSHAVILVEKKSNNYLVLDWYHPDYFYGEVSKSDLEQARLSLNEKNQFSAFSGFPINSSYKLIYIQNFPKYINISQCVKNNLYLSAKSLVSFNGALRFFSNAFTNIPMWIDKTNSTEYLNAIESLFYFNLELKLLIRYYDNILLGDIHVCRLQKNRNSYSTA